MSADVKTLFEAGAHFGHKTSRWHPKMERYIHSAKSGVHIIDLNQTKALLDEALAFIEEIASTGRPVLLVGTKRQSRELIEKAAADTGMPFVSVRWFGGMLTNFKTMQERIKRLKDLQSKMDSGELASRYSKLEVQRFQEEIDTLENNFGGIKDLGGLPGAVFVADVVTQANAVKEANKLGVPIVGIVDTNADPRPINHPIPANDDAIKTQELIIGLVAEAVNRGKAKAKAAPKKDDDKTEKTEQKTDSEAKKTEVKAKEVNEPAKSDEKPAKKPDAKKPAKTAKPKAKLAAKAKTAKKASK
jgi:small subunit ribosomal protein S2